MATTECCEARTLARFKERMARLLALPDELQTQWAGEPFFREAIEILEAIERDERARDGK